MIESRTRSLVLCGLSIALLAVGAFITVPFGPVPFTMQTLVLILLSLILTPREFLVAVGGYVVLGTAGLPIGAGFRGGLSWLLGPTGGFVMGFFVAAVVVFLLRSVFVEKVFVRDAQGGAPAAGGQGTVPPRRQPLVNPRSFVFDIVLALLVLATPYVCGTLWYALSNEVSLTAAFLLCVLPFLVPDALKTAAALVCAQPIRHALGRGAPFSTTKKAKKV